MSVFRYFQALAAIALTTALCACAPALPQVQTIDGSGKTGFTGQVVLETDNTPLEGAYVYIYPDTFMNLLGPAQYISSPTDKAGRYTVDVEPGSYYVLARKRQSGAPTGPLETGDFYTDHQRIQAKVPQGRLAVVNLSAAQMKAPMFFKREEPQKTDTGIRGLLLDAQGKPVKGAFAGAYRTPDLKRVPDFVSTLTGDDGSFIIYLPEGGTFYLAARLHAWDMPKPGELYGRLGDPDPQTVQVKKGGFVENIRIEMTPFEGQYKEGKKLKPF